MAQEKAKTYPIGELARRSRVPVKTIRHYSDVGVLPPARVTALDRLEGREKAAFLRRHLERALDGVPVDERWRGEFCQAAVPEMPDDPTDEQLAAWLELAELVADESFLARMREQSRPFW